MGWWFCVMGLCLNGGRRRGALAVPRTRFLLEAAPATHHRAVRESFQNPNEYSLTI